ncbi:OLC1v1025572C1 [Oldenlandia corymbosa var. corymbosa]|uniref:OLC1v1025572C1 n=1 Tax=Oldenlandia corymbosa var. corymbosa TaxID=529605 RepID=A0AAV1C7Z4_OLDCO|nr:OLC1v1025572C1 [Oldenlandia corymbosa var. corymbosa]
MNGRTNFFVIAAAVKVATSSPEEDFDEADQQIKVRNGYQRGIPDSLTLNNGRRTSSASNPSWKNGKEDEDREESSGLVMAKASSSFEGKGISRFRSPSKTAQENHIGNGINGAEAEDPNSPPTSSTTSKNHHNHESNGVVKSGVNDTFLQWGHRKRSRCSRGMGALTDETSSSTSNLQPSSKLQRRMLPQSPNSNANAMPPPSQPSTTNNGVPRGPNLRTPTKSNSSSPSPVRRNLEERSIVGGNKSPSPAPGNNVSSSSRGVSSRSRVGKKVPSFDKKSPRDEKMNNGGGSASVLQQHQAEAGGGGDVKNGIMSPPHGGGCSTNEDSNINGVRPGKMVAGGGEKGNNGGGNEVNEWPRIYIPLSRKEKEEDFLAMKGTKLPHRPKKRSKTVDRMLQYCFPGMWLSELTRGRYEVREKKCPKKPKRRGLKGMESLDSDSE